MTLQRLFPCRARPIAAAHLQKAATATVRLALPALVLVGTLGLTACREHEPRLDNVSAATLSVPGKRHPIGFAPRVEALYVEVASDGLGLSENQATDVHRFLDRYKSEANGRLHVAAPASVKGHFAVSRSFRDIEELIDRSGVPEGAVDRHRTRGEGRYGPAIKLSYERSIAMAPHCGSWPEDLGRMDRERLPYENFGCASQRNLALTVANARDLQVPQEETPRSSEMRSASWSKYVGGSKGTGGSGASGGDAGGGVSKPIKN